MSLRRLTWGLFVAAAVVAPARADDARAPEPTVVVRLKSFDGLLADFRFIAVRDTVAALSAVGPAVKHVPPVQSAVA